MVLSLFPTHFYKNCRIHLHSLLINKSACICNLRMMCKYLVKLDTNSRNFTYFINSRVFPRSSKIFESWWGPGSSKDSGFSYGLGLRVLSGPWVPLFRYSHMVRKLKNFNLIVNIILDYLQKTVHNLFSITTNIQGDVL